MADIYEFDPQSGIILTDSGEVLDQVSTEYKNTFGQDLIVPDSINPEGATTPQGALIVSEALARIAVADNNAAIANQINPNVAGGVFLDAILALTGIQRTPAQPSTVLCTITGVVGTIIPAGSQASVTGTGARFELVTETTIITGGTNTNVLFQSVDTGEIGADAGTLENIVSNVLGWETITNPADASLGQDTQSDIAARQLRNNTLAIQGSSVAEAITSGVLAVPGVTSMTFRENVAATTEVIDSVSMVAHSIYACVAGGTDLAVAEALISKKSAGAAYNNSVQAVLDGTTTSDSATITMVSTTGVVVGQSVQGTGIPSGATVVSISVDTSIVISLNATASGTVPLTFSQGVAVSQEVIVPYSGQAIDVLFDRPTLKPVLVSITVKVVSPVQFPVDATKQSIIDYANGDLDGIPGLIVGQNVSSFEIAGAVTAEHPGLYVQEVLIAFSPTSPSASTELDVAIFEQATISSTDISVTLL